MFAARDVGREIFEGRPGLARSLIGQGRVPVDADEVDVRIGPQRVQVEPDVASGRLMTEPLGPVRRVGDGAVRPEHVAALPGERPQLLHGRVAVQRVADGGHAP